MVGNTRWFLCIPKKKKKKKKKNLWASQVLDKLADLEATGEETDHAIIQVAKPSQGRWFVFILFDF